MNTALIKEKAFALGCHLVGLAPAIRFPEASMLRPWLAHGYAADMGYMGRHVEKREDPRLLFLPAKSVLVCGISYHSADDDFFDPLNGRISRYARGADYHVVLKNTLHALLDWIRKSSSTSVEGKVCVDTVPILERLYARYAGLGWVGKNTCLINQRYGSWVFLGEILLNLELEPDVPADDQCGACTRCLDACPTGALVAPRLLDARRCLSYLSIEFPGEIPEGLRPAFGNTVFGCDRCQAGCPWNQQAKVPARPAFSSEQFLLSPPLERLLSLSPEQFTQIFGHTPIHRAKWQGLLRNTVVAAGNSGDTKFIPILERIFSQADPLIQSHILWALERLKMRQ